ncbi:MAG TPA: serine/threonine-protein kinase [Thermoanaerobaculia bacterium]|nr:serine/threonine-protein kinase [Thermoanaerobaculia bacterium]
MQTCGICGFDPVEDGSPCPLCGSQPEGSCTPTMIEGPTVSSDEQPTVLRPAGEEPRPMLAPLLEQQFADRYRLEQRVGTGGMGTVYRVTDLRTGEVAALKVLHPSVARGPGGLERFEREMRLVARVRHPAIPAVTDWGRAGDQLYCVTEFIDGADLRAESRRRGRWEIEQVVGIGATAAEALAVAHDAGIIHRDIKPHNIMLDRAGAVRVVDFGLARPVGLELEAITESGLTVGTPQYMAPEQFEGGRIDPRSDLYSLGAVLFELLTGQPPFTGATVVEIGMKHRTEIPPLPRALRKGAPAWLESAILRCLAKLPEERFLNAHELAAELRRERAPGKPRRRILPTGDVVILDDSGTIDWTLQIATAERPDWSVGMALVFEGRPYKLEQVVLDQSGGSRPWIWSFSTWPDEEIFRRIVDYDEAASGRPKQGGIAGKLRGWLRR